MGKDAEPCCESCRLFGDAPPLTVADAPPATPLGVGFEDVRFLVTEKGGDTREVTPTGPEVWVGRVQGNHIVLPKGNISKRQCRFVFKDGKVIVVDTKSGCGTYVNGRKIMSPVVVDENATIYVGDFTLRITSTRAR
jgi:pSer/pThr/pTyr-binding forkhead associated (FHA) protein